MAQLGQAYDLDRFQPRETRLVALKNTKKVQEDTRRRTRRQSLLNVFVYLLLGLVTLTLAGYFITCNVLTTEMNKQLADGQAEYSALQSEEVRLKSELAALTSAEQVNQYVLEHGLTPVSSNQIYYIESKQQDQVSLPSEGNSWFAKAWGALVNFFG